MFHPTCNSKTEDYLSCGEEILYAASKSNERKKAADAVRAGDYELALKYYQSSWQQDGRDAETLIYWNNALLEASGAEYYTLAVAAPLSYQNADNKPRSHELGDYILRGVAQAQTAVNLSLHQSQGEAKYNLPGQGFLEPRPISDQKPKGLKIVIADDRNSEVESKKMAPTIAAKPKILGLMGHYASNVTLAAVDTYEKKQLAEVSFGSTTSDLSDKHPRSNFFRVVCSTAKQAQAIGDALSNLAIKDKKAAIFFNPGSDFSNDLRSKLEEIIKRQKLDVTLQFNLADDQNFSSSLALQKAKNRGTETSGNTATAYDATLSLIEAIKLQNNPTRRDVLTQLQTPGFTFDGATGQDIGFNRPENGDRLNFHSILVRLVNCENSNSFVPLSIDDPEASNLACQPEKSTS